MCMCYTVNDRYKIGGKKLPHMLDWVKGTLQLDLNHKWVLLCLFTIITWSFVYIGLLCVLCGSSLAQLYLCRSSWAHLDLPAQLSRLLCRSSWAHLDLPAQLSLLLCRSSWAHLDLPAQLSLLFPRIQSSCATGTDGIADPVTHCARAVHCRPQAKCHTTQWRCSGPPLPRTWYIFLDVGLPLRVLCSSHVIVLHWLFTATTLCCCICMFNRQVILYTKCLCCVKANSSEFLTSSFSQVSSQSIVSARLRPELTSQLIVDARLRPEIVVSFCYTETYTWLFMILASHSEVERVVQLATKHDVVIIPFGGQSISKPNVSLSLRQFADKRMLF